MSSRKLSGGNDVIFTGRNTCVFWETQKMFSGALRVTFRALNSYREFWETRAWTLSSPARVQLLCGASVGRAEGRVQGLDYDSKRDRQDSGKQTGNKP